MAYRYGQDRKQMVLFPQSIDEYVSGNNPVRAYDAFVDTLDLKDIGIDFDDSKVGNSQYDPRLMIKLLLFGYSYGIKSSRKLERETYNNIAFMWLMKGLNPDHKTIAEFRRKNKKPLKKAFQLCARLCVKLNLVEGNILFVDGTKINANASKRHHHTQKWYQNQLKQVDKRINQLLAQCEKVDQNEAHQGSWAKMPKELAQQERLKQSIVSALDEFKEVSSHTKNGKERRINRVDPESTLMRNSQGTRPGFNVQSVVDDKNGLIVSIDAVSDANDSHQLSKQVKAAEKNLDKECQIVCADAGYSNIDQMDKVESNQTKVVVPSQQQASAKPPKPFNKNDFKYDKDGDCHYCPMGQRLIFRRFQDKEHTMRDYRIEKPVVCRKCPHFGLCTRSNQGRTIVRHVLEETKETIEQRLKQPEYLGIYKNRKSRVEHPFGYIKKVIGFRQFGLKGRLGAQAEASIVATCFNLSRIITLLGGVESFIIRIQTV